MAKSVRSTSLAINLSPLSSQDVELGETKQEIVHTENRNESLALYHKWKISATDSGDTAHGFIQQPHRRPWGH